MNLKILLVWLGLVALQAICSFFDGYLCQSQMLARGIIGYSFCEHGGMWMDAIVIPGVVAFIVGNYKLPYLSTRSFVIFGLIIATTLFLGHQYRQMSMSMPEAGCHDGHTTVAGWIHGLYGILSAWIIILFFMSPFEIHTQRIHLMVIAALLSVWAFISVMKFTYRWDWDWVSFSQVSTEVVIIWVIAEGRIFLQP